MSIFQNPWVVGIATGLISGIIVFFITKFIANRKDKTEYYRKVKSANDDVIAALKPYIADRGLPKFDVFDSLIISVARTHQVQHKDMFTVEIFCEELIREIISDVYVSSDQKEQYSISLANYKKEYTLSKKDDQGKKTTLSFELSEVKLRYNRRLSLYLSLFASILGFVTIPLTMMSEEFAKQNDSLGYLMVIPVFASLSVAVVLTMFKITELLASLRAKREGTKEASDTEKDHSK